MKHDIYLSMKNIIKISARSLGEDKGYRRYILNNLLDDLCRELDNVFVLQGRISQSMAEKYKDWLTDYTIKRHNK